jgi:hypothetical protein
VAAGKSLDEDEYARGQQGGGPRIRKAFNRQVALKGLKEVAKGGDV